MHPSITTSIALFLVSFLGTATPKIVPSFAQRGELVTITYDASSPGSVLFGSQTIVAEISVFVQDSLPRVLDLPLRSKGLSHWGSFVIGPYDRFLAVQFTNGLDIDDNKGTSWTIQVRTSNRHPVRGARVDEALGLMCGQGLAGRLARDISRAEMLLDDELKEYPGDAEAILAGLRLRVIDAPSSDLRLFLGAQLNLLLDGRELRDGQVLAIGQWLERIGDHHRADSLRSARAGHDPAGIVAREALYVRTMAERNPKLQLRMLDDAERTTPAIFDDALMKLHARVLLRMGDADRATEKAHRLLRKDPELFSAISRHLWLKDKNLQRAAVLSKEAVNAGHNDDPLVRPLHMSQRQFKRLRRTQLGLALKTYAPILERLDQLAIAQRSWLEAVDALDGSDADANAGCIALLMRRGEIARAAEVGAQAVRSGGADDRVIREFRAAYTAVHGSDRGFTEELQRLRNDR